MPALRACCCQTCEILVTSPWALGLGVVWLDQAKACALKDRRWEVICVLSAIWVMSKRFLVEVFHAPGDARHRKLEPKARHSAPTSSRTYSMPSSRLSFAFSLQTLCCSCCDGC